ncbi:MAG TPA: hypothetical protein VMB50_23875 [Myxococcales bacterium]|nr:hypothetical protein [Myxococcales bacterium]
MGDTGPEVYLRVMRELHLDNSGVAKLARCSLRTIERHGCQILLMPHYAHPFVRAVHAKRPDLGALLARAAGTNLTALGLVPATAAERAAARGSGIATTHEVLRVLHAAAAATGLSLEQARAGVGAAVAMALDQGLTLETLDPLLNPKKPSRR